MKTIPLQDGEDSWEVHETTQGPDHMAIPDPLGLKDLDLIEKQEAFAAGRISLEIMNKYRNNKNSTSQAQTKEKGKESYGIASRMNDSDSEDEGRGDGLDEMSSDSDDENNLVPQSKDQSSTTPRSPTAHKKK